MPHTALSSKTHVQINTSDKTENGIVQIMQGRSIVTKNEKKKTKQNRLSFTEGIHGENLKTYAYHILKSLRA